jgi:hypothetical protein
VIAVLVLIGAVLLLVGLVVGLFAGIELTGRHPHEVLAEVFERWTR